MYYCIPDRDEVDYDPTLLMGYNKCVHDALNALNNGQTEYCVEAEVTFTYPKRQGSVTVTVEAGDSAPVCYWIRLRFNGSLPPADNDTPAEIGILPVVVCTD